MQLRAKDSYQTYSATFLKFDILVICPNCSKEAIVKPDNFSFQNSNQSDVKVICLHCGHNKRLADKPTSILYTSNTQTITGHVYVIGGAIDPFFYLPLWFQTDFEGHTLWAYNTQHLEFLQTHVEATLRERNGQDLANQSLGSRLPKWMTSKKNRDAVLKKLSGLQHN